MDPCGSACYTKNTKAKIVSRLILLTILKIQVFGLLVHLSPSITRFTLNAYQTVSLTVTLFTIVMRILILRWASHLDAFSGYPLHT